MFESLKQPISDDNPMGVYLRGADGDASLHRSLRNKFNNAQAVYRKLIETPDSLNDKVLQKENKDAWQLYCDQADGVLSSVSKDIEIFAWYIAAVINSGGSLHNLLQLIIIFRELLVDNIETIHPTLPDEKLKSKDDEARVKEIAEYKIKQCEKFFGASIDSSLLGKFLPNIELSNNIRLSDFELFYLNDSKESIEDDIKDFVENNVDKLSTEIIALDAISSEISLLGNCVASYAQTYGLASPSTVFLNRRIENYLNAIRFATNTTNFKWPLGSSNIEGKPDFSNEALGDSNTMSEQSHTHGDKGSGYTRKLAFEKIAELSHFFQQTEPHSPVYLLLERAVRWGQLSYKELYEEILGKDTDNIQHLNNLTGLESLGSASKTFGQKDIIADQSQFGFDTKPQKEVVSNPTKQINKNSENTIDSSTEDDNNDIESSATSSENQEADTIEEFQW